MAGSKRIKAGEAYIEGSLDDSRLKRGLRTLGGTIGAAGRAIGRGLAVGISAGVAAGAVLIRGALQRAADLQVTETAFETMLGSADEAQSLIQRLRDLGASTPFETKDLLDSTKVLLNFGAGADEAYDAIKMLSDVAAGDAQKLGSLALVFGQIRSAGKLTGGDLLQLINVGFNPLLSIAEKTGESMSDLRDRMSKGAVSFEEVRQAFVEATSAGGQFYQMNDKMSGTIAGRWSTMKDNWENLMTSMGTAMIPFVEKVFDYLSDITDGFNITTENIGDVWGRFLDSLIKQLEITGLAVDHWVLQMSASIRRGLAAGFANTPGMGALARRLERAAAADEAAADAAAKKMTQIESDIADTKRAIVPPPGAPEGKVIRGPVEAQRPPQQAVVQEAVQTAFAIASTGTFSGRGAAFLGGGADPVVDELKDANKILKRIEDNTEEGVTWG